jgi:hypothetical protein
VREAMGRSRWPMGYIFCDPDGKMLQMLWNRKAAEEGLEGVVVETSYPLGERESKEVVLTFKGEPLSVPQTSSETSKPASKSPKRSLLTTSVASGTDTVASTIVPEKTGDVV